MNNLDNLFECTKLDQRMALYEDMKFIEVQRKGIGSMGSSFNKPHLYKKPLKLNKTKEQLNIRSVDVYFDGRKFDKERLTVVIVDIDSGLEVVLIDVEQPNGKGITITNSVIAVLNDCGLIKRV
ncbi:hypothetical protein A3Q56_04109, partial [Intoshia linei]